MRQATTRELARLLQVGLDSLGQLEAEAFGHFALVLSLIPDVKCWSHEEQQALVYIVRAKVARDETKYLRLLQRHNLLRKEILRLGSGDVQAE